MKQNLTLNMYVVMSQQEVADKMNITKAAVAYFEKRALQKVRQKLATLGIYDIEEIV